MKRYGLPLITLTAVMATLGLLATSPETAESNYVLNGRSWTAGTTSWRGNAASFPASVGSTSAITTDLQDAADAWEFQSCANWSYTYLGTTGVSAPANDGVQAVFWTSTPGNGTLAVTTSWFIGSTMTHFDIRFHGDVTWTLNGGGYDVQGIGTHEFGHALGMGHDSCNPSATMWATTSAGSSIGRRSLEATDIAGVEAIYPGSCGGPPSPDPMTFGNPPSEVIPGTIVMGATPANPAPVEYLFTLVSSTGTGGDSSNWQAAAGFVDSGCSPNAVFTYNVKARNATTLAETAPSTNANAYTAPVAPGAATLANPTDTTFDVTGIDTGLNPAGSLVAIEVNGQYVGFTGALQANEFYFPATLWNHTVTGLTPGTTYAVRCKVSGVGTGIISPWGPTVNITTTSGGPLNESCAQGNIPDGGGGFADILTINGSAGGATREVTGSINSPITWDVAQPPTNGSPANFIVWGWIGIPSSAWEYTFAGAIGTLCFTPCEINQALLVVDFMSTYGPGFGACTVSVQANPTPFNYVHPGFGFGLPPITFQGICETSPGVLRTTNAIVFYYQ